MSHSTEELDEFKAEALELLDLAEKSLLSLDRGADYQSAFDAIFRGFHNLKGAAGMMELERLQAHTHELENILMNFKTAPEIPKAHVSLFLRGIDAAKAILDGRDIEFDYSVAAPSHEASEVPASVEPSIPDAALDEFISECEEILNRLNASFQVMEKSRATKDTLDSLYRDVHSLKGAASLFSLTNLARLAHAMESSLEGVRNGTHLASRGLLDALFKATETIERLVDRYRTKSSDEDLLAEIESRTTLLKSAADALEPAVSPPSRAESKPEAPAREKESEAASSIRVPVALLDNLMTLMGEMVLVRNQVLQFSNKCDDLEFLSMSKRLNVVTSEIQGEMMKTRMQPIGNILNKFNRVVRDLSQELGKSISLNLHGSETELDKSLLEAIKDPLTHIVRNSCDHGIEEPQVRRGSGKPENGTISIKAYHEGGQVVIEVADDGKGLHKDVILKKAMEKGIVSETQAARFSEKEIFDLIFAPGFSTAAKVTNVSGRGVGMDVVRTNIEKIGGTVDLTSAAGQGTVIKIKIPLTLAIVPALIVRGGGGTFAIPQVKLEELVRVDQGAADNKIEVLHGVPVYRLRGNILPLVDLNKAIGIESEKRTDDSIVNIAVLNAEDFSFGVIIDEVKDTADIVVKPLNRLLKSLQVYSGATILGDGSIALILDVMGLSKIAKLSQNGREEDATKLHGNHRSGWQSDVQDFLLVRLASPTKHAIALSYVHRLEEFDPKQVEISGSQRVIRYRDALLPLVSADRHLGYQRSSDEKRTLPVVVIQRAGTLYGIEVDEILDTLSTDTPTTTSLVKHTGIFGNLNTKEELIVVVDPFELITSAFPDSSPKAFDPSVVPVPTGKRVLLVEDTPFFRKTIKGYFESAGFEVVTASNGEEGLDALTKADRPFDLVVSDIEMPRLNGFQFAQAVRRNSSFAHLPLLAVSSRADKTYVAEGVKAGFDFYLEKLQGDTLIATAHQLLKRRSAA